jgi:protocatechuate 3,4-dioxygenase beta subunit
MWLTSLVLAVLAQANPAARTGVATIPGISEPVVRTRGRVLERETQRGIPGVEVEVTNGRVAPRTVTDAAGRFGCSVGPGWVTVRLSKHPAPFIAPFQPLGVPIELTAGSGETMLPEIHLVRGVPLRGRVLDEGGHPVTGARVRAVWMAFESPIYAPKWVDATTGEDGRFLLEGIAPKATAWVEARGTDAGYAGPEPISIDARVSPVVLHLNRAELAPCRGRVVDSSGRPVAGASVEIQSLVSSRGVPVGAVPALLDADAPIVTGRDGDFLAPRGLPRGTRHRMAARAAGYAPARTEWMPSGAALDASLARLRTIQGRVVDAQGRPLAGVGVFSALAPLPGNRAMTDGRGGFRLSEISKDDPFLFVEGTDIRFQGQMIDARGVEVTLTVARRDDPARTTMHNLPPALPRDDELSLASRLLEPELAQGFADGTASDKVSTLELLARLDPGRALEKLAHPVGGPAFFEDGVRRRLARTIARTSLDEALAVVESIRTPEGRAWGFLMLADTLPDSERARKSGLLDQALLHGKSVREPAMRAALLGAIAERWFDLGQVDRAKDLLREGRSLAAALNSGESDSAYARGMVAEALAPIDLEPALALVRDLGNERDHDRHHGNIAHELGGRNPAGAERVLALMRQPRSREKAAVKVCYRMAGVDLDRARRVALGIGDPYLRAHALGVMAQAPGRSNRDRAAALRLLDEAFTLLRQLAESDETRFAGQHTAAVVAAALLPVAERLAPDRLPEFFWRSISFLPPRFDSFESDDGGYASACLALLLARYDRTVARRIAEPVAARVRDMTVGPFGLEFRTLFAAAAAIDPRWAVTLLDGLPDDGPSKHVKYKSIARTEPVKWLARDPQRRWDAAQTLPVNLWVPDVEDLDYFEW